jgi:hypothetical protein
MSEQRVKLEVRLLALEAVTAHAVALLCVHDDPDPEFRWKKIHRNLVEGAKKVAFPELDPAQSDLFASELESALDRLDEMVATKIRHGLGKEGQ